MSRAAKRLAALLEELGAITDEPGRLTRTFLSPGMKRANALVGGWMKDAGLKVRVDTVGNLIGRLEPQSRNPRPKTLLLGSHLDTVRDAGRFDGPLGVLLPIVALAELKRRAVQLPFAVEVLGFSEEEGVRFASAYLGSEGYCGRLKPATLQLCDADGISVGDALKQFNGGKFTLPKPAHSRRDLLGYVEVHIEQGPVLEERNLAVGVVSAIAGQSRFKLTWTGKAGHAGTTPMALRRDALAAAAEFTLGIEAIAQRTRGLVATVGSLTVAPGAANVIPGQVVHTLDVRHADDRVRRQALLAIGRLATQIAARRRVTRTWQRTQENAATPCSPALTARLERSVQAVQGKSLSLVSGAGHDGVVMASLSPIAMLFVRCREGLSHHPDEYASPKDLGVALQVMIDFLQRLATDYTDQNS
ncbi:allantoate amidohydrolase [Oleiharenicola lentus]|uniref:Allantoate amidohydrolase n=1 Tax=Oleiharenicola lentus TaxID=2508720 RepID=A0A4Q1C9E6_9BACT|nr:allantoate amidohydrolase [Oleiharenicola lentus]RXK55604.1 allantoate amidohydrolase [Oleiharenicola lentus]